MENTNKWVLDPTHSELLFKVKHLMITNVKGEFRNFKTELQCDGNDFSKGHAVVTIDASSIFTNNEDRDAHLRSADFFNVEAHPEIRFESRSFEKKSEGHYSLTGQLSMAGVTREIRLDVDHGGIMKDPWGNEKAGFSVSGKFNRKDWGLNWNAALEAGGMLVSEEVSIHGEIQLVKQAVEALAV